MRWKKKKGSHVLKLLKIKIYYKHIKSFIESFVNWDLSYFRKITLSTFVCFYIDFKTEDDPRGTKHVVE